MTTCNDPSVSSRGDALPVGELTDDDASNGPETVLSLENVGQMFNISRFTLLAYEFRGLIKRRHRFGRIRVYGWADCDRLAFIIKCRRVGISLKHVATIIAAVDHEEDAVLHKLGQQACMELVSHLQERRKTLNEALAELAHIYALLSSKISGPDSNRSRD